ncbi:DUF3466 family protein [Vibrio profundum]|uniref:DUF3466 family protein n=1 Tax=Vibrio profundum TaxID=2910247 RepID=UPI003D1321B9
MSSIIFKRSLIAASLLVACQANAALYKVYEPTIETVVIPAADYTKAYGVAIQSGAQYGSSGCFTTGSGCDDDASEGEYKLAIETLMSDAAGSRYREEVPFGMDNGFSYIDSQNDYAQYCEDQLGYQSNVCDGWALSNYAIWGQEKAGTATPNSKVYIEDNLVSINTDGNTVINALFNDAPTLPKAVGNQSTYNSTDVDSRNKALNENTSNTHINTFEQSREFDTYSDGTYTYTAGSVSTTGAANNEGTFYYSQAAIWGAGGASDAAIIPYEGSGTTLSDNKYGSGSIRSFVINSGKIYAVGYNTYTDQDMDATVFVSSSDDLSTTPTWTSTKVSGAESGSDEDYSNSVLNGINNNLLAVGEAKRRISSGGALANRLFVVPNVSTAQSASFLSGGIFFSSAGGEMGAVNNYNEIVGQVDAEDTRETDGKPRRVRAFIDPYDSTGTDATRRAIFENKSWWLDDLTNGGQYSTANNAYRILDATDINDDGVISATAIKCSAGYSSTNDYATCDGVESTVAVKLIPIAGATSADIDAREHSYPKVDKKGGSFGLFGLAALGLFGIRRKMKS